MSVSPRIAAVGSKGRRLLGGVALTAALFPGIAGAQNPGTIDTAVGNGTFGSGGDGGPATSAQLQNPLGMDIGPNGDLYIADTFGYRIRRVAHDTGIITTIAGTGQGGFSGDGESALQAALDRPYDVGFDSSGNLYVADTFNHRIRRIDRATGVTTTVAGNGIATFAGDGKLATQASLHRPTAIAFDSDGRLYIADSQNNRVRVVGPNGIIETLAGNGENGYSGDGGPATDAALTYPIGVALDPDGHVFMSDLHSGRIRRVDRQTGVITTVAGPFKTPTGIGFDSSGAYLFVVDSSSGMVSRINRADDVVVTVAGDGGSEGTLAGWTGTYGLLPPEQSAFLVGDGGPATEGSLTYPTDIALDSSGNLFIVDGYGHRVRRVQAPF